jgi:hypothetical protein
MLSLYTLLSNWGLLFFTILLVGGQYSIGRLADRDLVLGDWRTTSSELYSTLITIAIPVFFMSSPFSTVLGLLSASLFCIIGHAMMDADRVGFFRAGGPAGGQQPRPPQSVRPRGRSPTQQLDSDEETRSVTVKGKGNFVSDRLYFADDVDATWFLVDSTSSGGEEEDYEEQHEERRMTAYLSRRGPRRQ